MILTAKGTFLISSLDRSSLSFAQRNRNPASTSTQSRSSARQVKVTSQGFYFGESSNGGGQAAERDLEKIEKELIRKGKKREQRIEELEVCVMMTFRRRLKRLSHYYFRYGPFFHSFKSTIETERKCTIFLLERRE